MIENQFVLFVIIFLMFFAGFALGDFSMKTCVSKAITMEMAKECFKND